MDLVTEDKEVYCVRHGEAEHNLKEPPEIYKGAQAELTPEGSRQAECIAERAESLPVDVIVSSTMLRARQTAGIIARRIKKPIVTSSVFVECMHPTSLEGLRWRDPEVQRIHTEWEQTRYSEQRVLDGENFIDIKCRSAGGLYFLEKRREPRIMLVSHGLYTRALCAYAVYGERLTAEMLEPWEYGFRTKNTGLTIMKYEPARVKGKWSVLTWNDHAHLGD